MSERKLATVRIIDEVDEIPNADAIEVCTIGGWKVVAQKGLYKAGDKAVYFEVDSFIPTSIAPFLTKAGHFPKTFNGVEGERLRTIRLRGQISQGLLIPCPPSYLDDSHIGTDVTEVYGIQKWEAPISAQLAGTVRGNFPSFMRKTDQERIQNLKKELAHWIEINSTWECTEKLDGSSMTVYVRDGEFGVCSRNLELKEDENNTFWKTALAYNLKEKLLQLGTNIAIQGELIGPGVQKNIYGLTEHKFYVYDIFDIDNFTYCTPNERWTICEKLGLDHVPIIAKQGVIPFTTIESLLAFSEGKTKLNDKVEREGLVFKCHEEQSSFKVISNKFLLKNGD